uniref:HIT domain-containing protein n=1 Tax=uncultured Sphingomonas sp. TaxID=158754 RepID=UPI0025DE431F|nr:HIT domain-containing protein [uncultured Sphingomonas sp.]
MPIDHKQPYDGGNVFARILRGELPCKAVLETEHSLAFHDLHPLAPVHVLVIPRGAYVSWDDFSERASEAEIADFVRAVGETARRVGADAQGYRLLANTGKRAGQEVPHLHVHLFGGEPLGPMLSR